MMLANIANNRSQERLQYIMLAHHLWHTHITAYHRKYRQHYQRNGHSRRAFVQVVVLIFRPTGLRGRPEIEKV